MGNFSVCEPLQPQESLSVSEFVLIRGHLFQIFSFFQSVCKHGRYLGASEFVLIRGHLFQIFSFFQSVCKHGTYLGASEFVLIRGRADFFYCVHTWLEMRICWSRTRLELPA